MIIIIIIVFAIQVSGNSRHFNTWLSGAQCFRQLQTARAASHISTLLQSVGKMQYLGACAKLWIATVRFIISVRPSIASQKIAQLMKFCTGYF